MAKRTCSVDGCERERQARGLCHTHYEYQRRNGIITTVPNTGRSRIMDTGYVRVWCPDHPTAKKDGYALEHRKVWHDANGPIPPGHHVHHRNRDRGDNRLANLELVEASDHLRKHVAEDGCVTNQHGTWPLNKGPCRYPDCDRMAKARGFCERCYQRVYKLGWVV